MFDLAKPFYPLLFKLAGKDPETAHRQLLTSLNWLDSANRPLNCWLQQQLEKTFCLCDPRLQQNLWGIQFNNPLGLAAGFDKDGVAAGVWSSFGFGLAELGAVTQHPQPGNLPPRLFRLPSDQAVLNRMGANNLGAVAIANNLKSTWSRKPRQIPIGINLCKSKITPLEAAAEDYVASFKALQDYADYFVVNVSSPNTPGLRSLQAGEQLEPILAALTRANQNCLPLLVKISPELDWQEIDGVINLAQSYRLAGIIATNTTTTRDGLTTKTLKTTGKPITEEPGGISGAPIRQRSTEVIRYIYQQTNGKLPIVGVGGIFTADHAWDKLTAGASLLQVYTGWIYQGPWLVKSILQGLLEKLETHQLDNIAQAVGMANRNSAKTSASKA